MRFGNTRMEFLGGRASCLTMPVISVAASALINASLP